MLISCTGYLSPTGLYLVRRKCRYPWDVHVISRYIWGLLWDIRTSRQNILRPSQGYLFAVSVQWWFWHRDPKYSIGHSFEGILQGLHSPIHHKPIPHVPDSTQPVCTHQFFSTKLVLHHRSPFLHTNKSQVGNVGRRYGLPTRFP